MNTSYTFIIIPFLTTLALSLLSVPYVIRLCKKKELYDMPNSRKVHNFAVPRLGGIIFMPITAIGMLVGMTIFNGGVNKEFNLYLSTILMVVGALLIYLIGLIDDLRGLRAIEKFAVQITAAMIFPSCHLMINNLNGLFGIYELPFWVSYFLTVFIILLIVNAMNLIDGIDGLSSGLSILILIAFTYLFNKLDTPLFVLLSICLCGSIIGFFVYNYFGVIGKHKIFMGDTGSLFIGFVVAYLAIKYQMSSWPGFGYREGAFLTSFTLLFIPCIDVIRVALQRLANRKGMFSPDKTHIHHLIMGMGFGMHQTLFTILLLYAILCIINWGLFVCNTPQTWIILLDVAIYSAFIWSTYKIGNTK